MPSDTGKTGAEYPFAQMMGQAKSAAEEFTKMFANLKLPAMPDSEALLTAYKRNLEALTAANRVALEGAQAVARRQAEIVQQTMAELSDSVRSLTTAESAQAKAAKQAELLRRAYEHAVANTKELTDLIVRSNGEAVEVLNRRFTEALDEVKTLAEKATPSSK
jgi:phasin family protein